MATVVMHIDQLAGAFLEFANILTKIRKYRKRWEINHDPQTKEQMKMWEEKADKLISTLTIENPLVEKMTKVIVESGLVEKLKSIEMDEFLAGSIKSFINSKRDNNELPAA